MRLVCPNCGAQYEVDDRVVPQGGRDVQCSNCGHAWFQRPAGWQDPDAGDDPDHVTQTPDPAPQDDAPVAAQAPADPDPDSEDSWDDDHPAANAPPRRPLDENVRDILAAEAQREMDARARDGGELETQPELGISDYTDPEAERQRIARERMARMRGIEEGETLEPEVPPAPPPEPQGKRALFPDIEEINSSLDTPVAGKPGPKREENAGIREPKPQSGAFRRAFSIVVILVALAFAVYAFAPRIVGLAPDLAGPMGQYVDFVNGLLAQIEALMQKLIDKMESMAGDGA